MKYQYKCIGEDGLIETGIIQAEDQDQVVVQLLQSNRRPISVEPIVPELIPARAKLSKKEQYRLVTQMGVMMDLGMDAASAVEIMAQSEKKASKRQQLLTEVSNKLSSGMTPADAFRQLNLLDQSYLDWMKLGETIGKDVESLKSIQRLLGAKLDTRSKVAKAIMYPAILMICLFGAILMITRFVFPVFAQLMQEVPIHLWPLSSRMMLWVGQHAVSIAIIFLFLVVMIRLGITYSYRATKGEVWHQWITHHVPWKSSLQMKREVELLESIILMHKNAIPLQQALSFIADHTHNPYVRAQLHGALVEIDAGTSVAIALENTKLYSSYFNSFIKRGERGKVLIESMEELYMIRKAQRTEMVERRLKLVEPISIMVIGVMVAFVMLGTLLPIFEMSQYVL